MSILLLARGRDRLETQTYQFRLESVRERPLLARGRDRLETIRTLEHRM